MSLTRREFLRGMGGILAAGVAPAFIGADVLMPVKKILLPPTTILWGDGVHDDAPALQAFINGERVLRADGREFDGHFAAGTMRLEATIVLSGPNRIGIIGSDITSTASPMFYAPEYGSWGNSITKSWLRSA